MQYSKVISLLMIAIFISSVAAWAPLSAAKENAQNQVIYKTSARYTVGNYTIEVINNETVILSSHGLSVTVTPTAYYNSNGVLLKEPLTSGKVNRINDRVQNTVGVIDQFKYDRMTFVYGLDQGTIDISIVNSGGSTYMGMNFSTAKPDSASVSGLFPGKSLNSTGPGHYVLGDQLSSFYENFYYSSLTLSWDQFTYQNEYDYGIFSAVKAQSSLDLMLGPLGNAASATTYGPIAVSMG
ncbi:hypothetical protein IX51_10470 [uncultured archaeon]|nr:hypothetical protein IX51_10470 [uncultured archaeon]